MPINFRYDPELRVLFSTAEGLLSFLDIEAPINKESEGKALGHRELFDARVAYRPHFGTGKTTGAQLTHDDAKPPI
jgi:hypothetical protein